MAYLSCRAGKRGSTSAIEFECGLAKNLRSLRDDLNNGTYIIGRSRVFVVTKPRPREVWAAEFRDRIVHHLIYARIGYDFEKTFSVGSSACISGRGPLYGSSRLEHSIRSGSENWTVPLHYLKMDISNFFVSIQKSILDTLVSSKVSDSWTLALVRQVLHHDPTENYVISGDRKLLSLVPKHKSLFYTPSFCGLPIGNLSSQFLANVHMNELDRFVEHTIKPHGYVRYVDDFILVDRDLDKLREAKDLIESYLWDYLLLVPNPTKTVLNSVYNGVDFVGRIVKPWRTVPRRTLANNALAGLRRGEATVASLNSTLGLLRQSKAFRERKSLCREAMRNGYSVSSTFQKVIA